MASPKFFQNASQFTIQESEFNAVAGDLIMNSNTNNYFGGAPSSQMISASGRQCDQGLAGSGKICAVD
ncbi:hypothetical protein BT96DRAFT_306792 [Gymnopus androsaceus JB14]|uniref:Uncharacterized protein n=1 Tax=Gymnopus androsaceus JB14 TaxID=1447944 RepID=A0A6A4IAV2_9AGAR|nr:hypothetical protein BT96DRAFT_306792 [Gymnopus androsaceus JB14]